MRLPIIAAILTLTAGASEAGTYVIANTDGREGIAVDLDSIKRDGDVATFWETIVEREAKPSADIFADYTLSRTVINCRSDTISTSYAILFMIGKNSPVWFGRVPDAETQRPVVPDTGSSAVERVVCSTRKGIGDPFYGDRESFAIHFRKILTYMKPVA